MERRARRSVGTDRAREPEEGARDALASPVRIELLEAAKGAPVSIAELAARLGRTTHSLYYHVRKLEQAGLLRQAGVGKTRTRDRALYRVESGALAVRQTRAGAEEAALLSRSARAILHLTLREVRAAIGAGALLYRRGGLDAIRRRSVRLTHREHGELVRRIRALDQFLGRCARTRRGQPFIWTTVLVPSVPKETPSMERTR